MISIDTRPSSGTFDCRDDLPNDISGKLFLDADYDMFIGTAGRELIMVFAGGCTVGGSVAWPIRLAPSGSSVTIEQD